MEATNPYKSPPTDELLEKEPPAQPSKFRSSIIWLMSVTIVVSVVEWLMLELLRTPYRPPHDMLTLLGTEKYGLVGIMVALSVTWLIFVATMLMRSKLSKRNYLSFIGLVVVILVLYIYILNNPHRAVTPWRMIWS